MRGLLVAVLLVGCAGKDTDTESDTDTDSDTVSGDPIVAVAGARCALDTRIGSVTVEHWGGDSASFTALIWDKPDPWMGAPSLTNEHCAFHSFDVNSCGRCDSGEVCSVSGECVPERRTVKDFVLVVSQDGSDTEYTPTVDGYAYGQVATGSPIGFELRLGGRAILMEQASVPSTNLNASLTATGDYDKPGTLTATWTDPGDGTLVSTVIPINHHAGGPTFTACDAEASDGGFVADAAMVDPLAVITGLEFQGLDHQRVAAAEVEGGCIEFAINRREMVDVQFPR